MDIRPNVSRQAVIGLAILVVLAVLVRLPGLHWGFIEGEFHPFHPDENRILRSAYRVYQGLRPIDFYPSGYASQVGIASRVLGVKAESKWDLLMVARSLSLIYSVLTVLVVFGLARRCGWKERTALVAAGVYALAGLPITYSWYAVTDSGLTFWIAMTVWLSLCAHQKKCLGLMLAAVTAAGIALSFKLFLPAVLPLIAALLLTRCRWRWWMLALLVPLLVLIAQTATLWSVNLEGLRQLWRMIDSENLRSMSDHRYELNAPMLFIILVPSLGLPAFALACAGMAGSWVRRLRTSLRAQASFWLIVVVPALATFAFASVPAVTFPRHILPVLPLLALAAGWGWEKHVDPVLARWSPVRRYAVLAALAVYQGLYVWSINEPYVRDTRHQMARYVAANVDPESRVYVDWYSTFYKGWGGMFKPTRYPHRAKYALIHEGYYWRYLRSSVNPSRAYPRREQTYNWRVDGPFIHSLFLQEDTPFRELKRFRPQYLTPELQLYHRVFGAYPDFLGDCILFVNVEMDEEPPRPAEQEQGNETREGADRG